MKAKGPAVNTQPSYVVRGALPGGLPGFLSVFYTVCMTRSFIQLICQDLAIGLSGMRLFSLTLCYCKSKNRSQAYKHDKLLVDILQQK